MQSKQLVIQAKMQMWWWLDFVGFFVLMVFLLFVFFKSLHILTTRKIRFLKGGTWHYISTKDVELAADKLSRTADLHF